MSVWALVDIQVGDEVVMKKLRKLRQDKSPGADEIQPRYLKEIALTIIFRKSLDHGEIPEDWRIANVIPYFQEGKQV